MDDTFKVLYSLSLMYGCDMRVLDDNYINLVILSKCAYENHLCALAIQEFVNRFVIA